MMKKLLPLLIFLFTQNWMVAQQIHVIPSEAFPDLPSMVDYINQHQAENSDLIFEIKGDERFECPPIVITATGQQNAQIIIRWDGTGNKPVLNFSGSDLDMESGIVLSGAQYTTLDGLNITNDDGELEYGIFITNSTASKGSQYNTIRNTHITLNKNNIRQTVGVIILPTTVATEASGSNSYNSFVNNHISNCMVGYRFDSTTGNVQLMDTENKIMAEAGKEHLIEDIVFAGIHLLNQNGTTIEGIKIHNLHRPADLTNTAPAAISTTGTLPSGPLTQPFVISNNSIKNNHSESTSIFGMYLNQRNVHYDVFNNTIDNIYTTATGGSYASGIFVFGTDITANIYNNDIRGIAAAAGSLSNAASARGIDVRSFNWVRIYHNTVLLNYESVNADNKSGALNIHNASNQVDIRNNIFINLTTVPDGGMGFATAIFKSSTTLTNIATTSNNNIYYAGTPSGMNLIFYGHAANVARDQTLEDFQQRAWSFDQNSFTENVPFINDLFPHIDLTQQTLVRGNAQPITSPIIVDVDSRGNPRDPQQTDIGAIELAEPVFAKALNPTPAHLATEVSVNLPALTWQYPYGDNYLKPAGFHVYAGKLSEREEIGWVDYTQGITEYALPLESFPLDYSTTYYWEIVPSADAETGPETSQVDQWQFTIQALKYAFPAPAIHPSPVNNAEGISLDLNEVTWEYHHEDLFSTPAGFRVYVSKDPDPEQAEMVAWIPYTEDTVNYSAVISDEKLLPFTSYYWLIIPVAEGEEGPENPDAEVWKFETLDNVSVGNLRKSSVKFYPNPASATLHISSGESQTVRISDITGRVVLEQYCLQGEQVLNINSLNPGIYQIQFMDKGTLQSKKLIKQ